jgi:hypothetical protein
MLVSGSVGQKAISKHHPEVCSKEGPHSNRDSNRDRRFANKDADQQTKNAAD